MFRSTMCGLIIFILVLMNCCELFSQPVAVEELARATELPILKLNIEDHRSEHGASGTYFKYLPPTPRTSYGVLWPVKDQSCLTPPHQQIWPAIYDGTIACDVASSVKDKVRQLKTQLKFHGPQVYGLGMMQSGADTFDLVLPVEHIDGIRIPRDTAERTPEMNDAFFGLFLQMVEEGWIPLDYHYENVVIHPQLGVPRPVDVYLARSEELDQQANEDSRVGRLRNLQVAQTIVELDRSSTDRTSRGYLCRSIIKELRSRYPSAERWVAGILKKVNFPH